MVDNIKHDYYYPNQISYTYNQILWLLRNVLFQTEWPSDNIETGYTGGKGRKVGHHANFEVVQMITAELSARLKLCGAAGLYLEYLTCMDFDDYDSMCARLAGYFSTTSREVSYQANLALRFCCRRKRKLVTFKYFCKYTRSRDSARKRIRMGR